jgi:hypothetical protein
MRTTTAALTLALAFAAGPARAENADKPDEEGFIRNWLVLAPLPLGADSGTEALGKQQLPDEAKLKPTLGQKVKAGDKTLTWARADLNSHLLDFNALLGGQTEDSVAYAVCYLVADKEMTGLTLKMGSDDQAKVYLNGKEVVKNEDARPTEKDQNTAENVTLTKGVNVVVFKVVNEKMEWSGCIRFTDKGGSPVRDLKVRLKP